MRRASLLFWKQLGAALAPLVAAVMLLAAAPAAAAPSWGGRLALGYGKLFLTDAPGGGFSTAVGFDYPARPTLRIGADLGYHLLGTRSVERGSSNASIDYSLLEVSLRAHWYPAHAGILHRVSLGPALMGARADISSSSSGLLFEDLAVSELRPGLALDFGLAMPGPHVVAVGIEAGIRTAFVRDASWSVGTVRLVFEY